MELLKGVIFVVTLLGWLYWTNRRKWLHEEFQRNEQHEPPSERQLRWDIRHLREDISILVICNFTVMVLLLVLVVFGR